MGAPAPTLSTATPASARQASREPTARATSTSAPTGETPLSSCSEAAFHQGNPLPLHLKIEI